VKVSRWVLLPIAAVIAVGLAAGGALLRTDSGSAASKATFTASLISDIGKFNDRSFNQSQLEGLKRAKAKLGVSILPLQSNSASDYLPNMNTAVRKHANLIIAAGFLLAPTLETVAAKFPNTDFAITDYCAKGPKCYTGSVLTKKHPNVMGLDYAANQSGCLVGVLAAKMAQKEGGDTIGAVGGLTIPPVTIWIAGYKYCARKAVPGTKVLVGYSQSFTESDKCKTVAENQLGQGAKVLFQVAGGCGLGTLKAADEAGAWGIGVDKDQYKDAKRVLTSGVKRVDKGIFNIVKASKEGKFKANTDLLFTLKNGGMSVGKINPAVPKSYINLMNSYKAKIIKGQLTIPTHL
jgi:basic membrane protein A and related proteins